MTETSTVISDLPELDLLPLQYYLDMIISSVRSVVSMVSGFFSSLPEWVLIVYGVAVTLSFILFLINKITG